MRALKSIKINKLRELALALLVILASVNVFGTAKVRISGFNLSSCSKDICYSVSAKKGASSYIDERIYIDDITVTLFTKGFTKKTFILEGKHGYLNESYTNVVVKEIKGKKAQFGSEAYVNLPIGKVRYF